MQTGIYLRNIMDWSTVPPEVVHKIDWVVCGDYGCPYCLPDLSALERFHQHLLQQGLGMHYISPKIHQSTMDEEAERVNTLLTRGISVSINDWGLFHRLSGVNEVKGELYLGRLLTKSLGDWAWASIFLAHENAETREYFMQNNFHQQIKMEYFLHKGVAGVEVNIHPAVEASCADMERQGLAVIGFADNTILSVSRSCPIARLHEVRPGACSHLCQRKYQVVPQGVLQQQIYPTMELWGNVVYHPRSEDVTWKGYRKLIYDWEPNQIDRIESRI